MESRPRGDRLLRAEGICDGGWQINGGHGESARRTPAVPSLFPITHYPSPLFNGSRFPVPASAPSPHSPSPITHSRPSKHPAPSSLIPSLFRDALPALACARFGADTRSRV